MASLLLFHGNRSDANDRKALARSGRTIKMKFSGTSKSGNFQEALDYAIQEATTKLGEGGADIMINWHLLTVSGVNGGIAGLNTVTVEILAVAP